ncbi:hypothetical protein C8T65DRAFT_209622 [Cerioporus squamosus]|nr:hypothetical protein C8T65DRAFT_209622 [Cerioporus squamosus]
MQLIPQELQDRIIDSLAPDRIAGPSEHYADLRACALTCRSWLPRAQCQLYKHVELDRLESIRLFARTLQESPAIICPLVKRLEFWFKTTDCDSPPAPVEQVPFPESLFKKLTALCGLRFACYTNSLALTTVQVEFMKKWSGRARLRTLWIDGFYFDTLADLTGWAGHGTEVDPADFPGRCQSLTTVEMLETDKVDDLLPLLGTAIEKLSIAWMWDASAPDTYAAVSTLFELRSLVFQVNCLDHPWVASVLAQVRSAHLEEFTLDFTLLDREEDSAALGLLLRQEGLDDLLSLKPLDGIHRLKIVAFGNNNTGKAERRLREAEALLPRFVRRGTIEVVVETCALSHPVSSVV